MLALPLRYGGLGIQNPEKTSVREYIVSRCDQIFAGLRGSSLRFPPKQQSLRYPGNQICFILNAPLERFAFGKTPRGPRCARQARQRLVRNT